MFARWSFVTKAARRRGSVTERRGRRCFAPAVAALEDRNLLSVMGMAQGESGKPVVVERIQVTFPGGHVISIPGNTSVTFPGGRVHSTHGSAHVAFPGGSVSSHPGHTLVNFPGGHVISNPGGSTTIKFPGGSITF